MNCSKCNVGEIQKTETLLNDQWVTFYGCNRCNHGWADGPVTPVQRTDDHMKNHEIWIADLFGELIQSGLRSDEHLFWKDRSYYGEPDINGESSVVRPPSMYDIENVNIERVMNHMLPMVREALAAIIRDYSEK